MTDAPAALTQRKTTHGRTQVVGPFDPKQGYGVISPLKSPNTAAVNDGVGAMIKDGSINRLINQYLVSLFGVAPSSIPMWNLE